MAYQMVMVGLGGFFGAIARYLLTFYFSRIKLFPIGTFLVNTTGSFLMGWLLGNQQISQTSSLLMGTGFLGAYTTFSTFNFELFMLKKNRRNFIFLLYLISSYVLGFGSAAFGYSLGKQ